MLNIVLFGPPGAGKGTQSEKIIEKYNLVHFSTGDILRAEIKNQTSLGNEAKKFMDKGSLVPDSIVIGMIENKLDANMDAKGYIFDGFPRTSVQAKALDDLLVRKQMTISGMLALDVEHDELVNRLLLRGKESGRSDDQDRNVIENRITVYHKETEPVMNYYKAQNKFHSVIGVGSVDEIFENLNKVIERL